MNATIGKTFSGRAFHFVFLAALSLAVYSNTFTGPIQFDDAVYIQDNEIIRDFGYFLHPSRVSGYDPYSVKHLFSLRYVAYLSFAANYALGGLDTTGYHMVNFAIHLANVLLLYWLVLITFRTPFLRESPMARSAGGVAFLASLLFAVHPVQTQAVAYMSQRFASLVALFSLLSVAAYAAFRLSGTRGGKLAFYALALASAALAMKTKETAFTLPLAIALYEFLFFRGDRRGRLLALLPFLLTMLIVPLTLFEFEKPLGAMLGEATRTQLQISRHDYFLTQLRVMVTYLRLLLLPVNQNLDYDYPLMTSFFSPPVLASAFVLLCVAGLSLRLLLSSGRGRPEARLAAFGILWFFLALSVESSFIALADLIFEHRLYLPSAGVFMAASVGVSFVKERASAPRLRALIAMGAVLALAAFSVLSYARNGIWSSQVALWQDALSKSPGKPRPYNNLGLALIARGEKDRAIELYEQAIALDSRYANAHTNLAIALAMDGKVDEAIEHYVQALHHDPGSPIIHGALGAAYASKGLYDKAIDQYKAAITENPSSADAHNNLALAYEETGRTEEAVMQYMEALRLNPEHAAAHHNLGTLYLNLGQPDLAIEHLLVSLRLKPGRAGAHVNLGDAYMEKGMIQEAVEQYEKALEIQPGLPDALYGLTRVRIMLETQGQ